MSYNSDFERDFIQRSLDLVKEYKGSRDATLLLNCLLGLVVVPNETCLGKLPKDRIDDSGKWGISPDAIQCWGSWDKADGKSQCENCDWPLQNGRKNPTTLRTLVKHLRNAVTHFRFRPISERGEVKAFHFCDRSGFRAEVELSELREFVERLAKKLKVM